MVIWSQMSQLHKYAFAFPVVFSLMFCILLCRCFFSFQYCLYFFLKTELQLIMNFLRLNMWRYQFNPAYFQTAVTSQILLKALTNLPHTDFTLCKCMIDQTHVSFCCSYDSSNSKMWRLERTQDLCVSEVWVVFPWLQCRSKRNAPSDRSCSWATCWRPAIFRASGYETHACMLVVRHLLNLGLTGSDPTQTR